MHGQRNIKYISLFAFDNLYSKLDMPSTLGAPCRYLHCA